MPPSRSRRRPEALSDPVRRLDDVTSPVPLAYLDHAATTPVRPEALAAYAAALAHVGNPASAHGAGRAARRRLEESREGIAAALGARPREVVLTSGGTEADNLAVKGLFWARRAQDPRRTRVLVSAVEHHAVLDAARWLAVRQGATVVELAVDAEGRLDLDALRDELAAHAAQVALVSVMWANNEVGTVQPLPEVVAVAAAHGVPVHADAVQAVGQVPVDVGAAGLTALSLSGHKLGGTPGTGALLVRTDADVVPLLHGGGQERGVRSGTADAAGAAALAVAVAAGAAEAAGPGAQRLARLQRRLVDALACLDGVHLRGAPPGPGRLPGNVHVTVEGASAEVLLYLLDTAGIAASSGAACRAGVEQPSHVLLAMGASTAEAASALRLTLGHTSTDAEVDAVLEVLPGVVERARRVSALATGAVR